ncbi:ABC transporter, putative [Trypanosoma cruzi marinkellei]|uniref:ABC transporter, putative n=1 Tax=Trypanosoma cruzi marinkellei TaxID=85056 RepID=K2MS75_TRYCR|nr:ABC transporter, putative [Trypanosoma cruzi marinkellei]
MERAQGSRSEVFLPQMTTAPKRSRVPLFAQQLLSTLKLNFLQRIRSPISSIVEVLIPIVFILGTVAISTTINDEKYKGEEFLDYQRTRNTIIEQKLLFTSLCYDSLSGTVIDGLLPCDRDGSPVTCFGKDQGLPVNGICIHVGKSTSRFENLVVDFFSHFGEGLVPIPSFDDMVKLQWFAHCISVFLDRHEPFWGFDYSGWLYFTPENEYTVSLVSYLRENTKLFKYVFGRYFNSTKEADEYLSEERGKVGNWGVIQVNGVSNDPNNPYLDVSIRLNSSALPSTASIVSFDSGGGNQHSIHYLVSGFLTLQKEVYGHYIKKIMNLEEPLAPFILPMGTVDRVQKLFLSTAGNLVPLLVVLGFLYPISQTTRRIVLDKELRMKEAMLIMGLWQSVQYLAWFIIATLQSLLVSIACAVLLKISYLKSSNFGVIFFLFFFFTLTSFVLAGLIASFFSKSRLSSMVAPLAYFLLSVPLFAIESVGGSVVSALCLLSPTAFAKGLMLLFNREMLSGFTNADINSPFDKPNMIFVLILLFVDLCLYTLLMLYFDAVMPKEWGTPKHPLFCIIEPIRKFRKKKREWTAEEDGRNPFGVYETQTCEDPGRSAVRICGLTKVFKRGGEKFFAVNHLHLNLVEDEISVLLGHNGAGKSTTMNMMTGMLKPDGGDCYIYGHSIRKQLGRARQEIGFCPQHNILWPNLTCYEHLEYFSSIKGLTGSNQKKYIDDMLTGVDLQDKRHCVSSSLSGGQKRKLSLAIAFVGNSRLVFLDEPTAGMDVAARRHTWELLRRMSAGRTILLSTHFMDEADLLGDRIMIMSRGSLQCAGSSVFLKSNLGVGYNITLSVTRVASSQAIWNLIRSHIPPAELLSSNAGEITYRLPMAFVKNFPPLLRDIEGLGEKYGVQSYTLSATTLEEIFLKIAHGDGTGAIPVLEKQPIMLKGDLVEMNEKENKNVEFEGEYSATHKDTPRPFVHLLNRSRSNSGIETMSQLQSIWETEVIHDECKLMLSQLRASLMKRLLYALRDRRTQFIQLLFPVVMLTFALLLHLVNFFTYPSLLLSSNMYGEHAMVDLADCEGTIDVSIPFAKSTSFGIHNEILDTGDLYKYLIEQQKTGSPNRYTSISCNDFSFRERKVLLYNGSAFHSSALSLVEYYSAVLYAQLRGASTAYQEDIFVTHNFPMGQTKDEDARSDAIKTVLMGILAMIPFSFIPSTFVSFVVKERECKARHLQKVSGMRFSIYWLSNYIFDFCCYLITTMLAILIMLIFNRKEYISSETIGATLVLFIMYGLSSIAMSYAVSFLFKQHASAQNVMLLVNFIAGFFLVLLVIILKMFESTENAAKGLQWAFRLFPSYCVGEGILNLALLPGKESVGGKSISPWELDVVGHPAIYMACDVLVFSLITILLDHPTCRMRIQNLFCRGTNEREEIADEDEDVAMERRRIQETENSPSEDIVRVENLRKVYSKGKVAVRNLSLGVKPGEVFGFLGTNGAGKTTTIAILCQEMLPTSGRAFICGKDIVRNSRESLHYIGYCPQFDALIELLTVEEHLNLYAGIRGVKGGERETVVRDLMCLCELTTYFNTRAGELSGGNKRKLSVAIALIGGPRVVFLDEPSAGMDPVARRGLWTAIQGISSSCSVVLTTHHLEEVEALAHRVAIMVNGSLRCLGNKTHLKRKYGSGFEMVVRMDDFALRERVDEFIAMYFPAAKLNEVRGNRCTYALPATTILSEAFALLEAHKDDVGIADYTLSQTSIEQVFLRISEEAQQESDSVHFTTA